MVIKMKKEKILNKNVIYKGKVLTFSVSDVTCPNGNLSQREMVSHNGGVCILAEYNGKIVLERQYRFPYDDFIIELPAGKLEPGEKPYDAAIRELEEEVGLKAESLVDYGIMYPSVGYTNEIIYLYKANNVTKTKTHFDDDEEIETILLSKEEIKEYIDNGIIKDAKTLILLLKYLGK